MVKKCGKCGKEQPLAAFSFKNRTKRPYSSYCKECNRSYQREHYRRNTAIYSDKRHVQRRMMLISNRMNIMNYLRTHPCIDCGEHDPVVLEFDHVTGVKTGNISNMVSDGLSWERIKREISLCEVRCANCHKRKTAQQLDWYKNLNYGAFV